MNKQSINNEIKEAILNRKFLMIKDVPFCLCPIEHCSYLYFGSGKGKKETKCESCKLKAWCDYDIKLKLKVNPIEECDKDLLKFLEERDENINDWF